jgi:hypothetical protein
VPGESRAARGLLVCRFWAGRLLELAERAVKQGWAVVWCAECAPLNGVQVGGGGSGALGEGREGGRGHPAGVWYRVSFFDVLLLYTCTCLRSVS